MKLDSPARKITKNFRSLTGVHSNTNNPNYSDFESSLERDFLLHLEFNKKVREYKAQALTIYFLDVNGVERSFTPDVYVKLWNSEKQRHEAIIYEVKYREELKENWNVFKPKFKAAIRYAKENGIRFKIITEKQIRTPYLENIKFLKPHLRESDIDQRAFKLLGNLANLKQTTPSELIKEVSDFKNTQAEYLFTLWQLIARGEVVADLNQPLKMNSIIKVNDIWEDYVHEE